MLGGAGGQAGLFQAAYSSIISIYLVQERYFRLWETGPPLLGPWGTVAAARSRLCLSSVEHIRR
jgi:hypothetical protein